MKFKQIKKREVYETWFNKNRLTGLVSYIHFTPKSQINDNDFFHFSISCTRKTCNKQICNISNCDRIIRYSSLNDNLKYNTFEECVEAVEDWHKINRK